ncbi:MAG: ABC transporter substrate-binding protein [Anaerolineae bacterium]|nr:ABC transporter substrate-binding protein [Thermoflexales bacterium]MDW8406939.1 ABC transporter substrate-binding protein [Anaerolineae bacterium]
MRHFAYRTLCSCIVIAALLGCRAPIATTPATVIPSPTEPPLVRVRLPMGYIANVQYAPFYIAGERGYFQAEGIEIEFDYKFETDGVKLVAAGELPFAVVSGEQVVLARAQGLPVKYIMQWYHQFPVAVIALQSSGIQTPQDLKGKTIGLPGFFGATYVGWRAFLAANGLSESDVTALEIGFTQVAALQQKQVDAVVGYSNNEPVVLEANGYPVTVFKVSDQVDMVANGILTSEQVAREQPDLARRFVRAVLRGIADAIADPEAAMQISTEYVEGLEADDPVQRKVLLESIEMMKAGTKRPGESTAAAWQNTVDTLVAMEQVQRAPDVTALFTNEFLP